MRRATSGSFVWPRFARKPISEVLPELIEAVDQHRRKPGRPKSDAPKVHVGFRLSADLVERIRASGPGCNARVEEALRRGFMAKAPKNRAAS